MYNNKMYKRHYYVCLKCARSARKFGLKKLQITKKIPWFFQVDFSKFHDFSRFLGLFSNSMIFPGLENLFFIFQVSMIFPEAGNPVLPIILYEIWIFKSVMDGRTESDAYDPTVQYAQVGSIKLKIEEITQLIKCKKIIAENYPLHLKHRQTCARYKHVSS